MTSVGRTLNSRNDCSAAVEPTNLPEQLTAYLSEVLHESLHILPPREQLISTELAKSNTSTRNWIYGSRACPDSFAELNGSGIKAERSICPFHYEMDYDETRYDMILIKTGVSLKYSCIKMLEWEILYNRNFTGDVIYIYIVTFFYKSLNKSNCQNVSPNL